MNSGLLGPLRLMREHYVRKRKYAQDMPDWKKLLRKDGALWRAARETSKNGPRVLIATSIGGEATMALIESTLGVALTLRGASVGFLLCDGALPACMRAQSFQFQNLATFSHRGPSERLCPSCYAPAAALFANLGLQVDRYSKFIGKDEVSSIERLSSSIPLDEISQFELDSLAVGEHAHAGALRFFARGELPQGAQSEAILRRYFRAALMTARVAVNYIRKVRPEVACFHHGIYVPQGILGAVCRREGVRVVNWAPAYRKQSFIFSHSDTYHHTLMEEPVSEWTEMQWSASHRSEIEAYLKSRWQGTRDWIRFHESPEENLQKIASDLGLDRSKTSVGLLTNVVWDAQLHYRANAFPNMIAWVLETIRYFAGRPDLQLLIRVHPAEIRGTIKSLQPILAEIAREFPVLPENVFIIPPESPVSTYAAMQLCNSVIIYGTKTGVELTSMGIPVIVAGEAWIRNKGLTVDVRSADEYRTLLDKLPLPPMPPDQVELARKYAFHFFFRRMIPVPAVEPRPGMWPPYQLALPQGLKELAAGTSTGLDIICEGILQSAPFVYPAERDLELARLTEERQLEGATSR